MKTISDPTLLERLIMRLRTLRPDSPRKWGTLTPGEMLCHLGDATDSVLNRGSAASEGATAEAVQSRPVLKWIALRSPLPWPQALKTPPTVDPRADGSRPGDFETDRRRAIDGLITFLSAPADAFAASHGAFGRMSVEDWRRWAYRHTDHHLRQFGL